MSRPRIEKRQVTGRPPPNMTGYDAARSTFSWEVALRWIGREGQRRDISYAELQELTSRFASALAARGVSKGDSVFTLLGRVPELYVSARHR